MTKTYNKSKRVNFLRTLGWNAQGVPLLLARVPLVRWMRRVIHKTRRTGILTNPIKRSIILFEGICSLLSIVAKETIRLINDSRRIFVNLSSKLRLLRQKERAIMRSTLKGRIAALAATFVVALSLAACGGGGGDGSDSIATVPVATPVALTPSWSNAPVATSSGTEAAKQFAAKAPLRANGAQAAPVDPYGGVDPFNAIEQLLDFGERNFPQYFPDHRATAVYEKFRYRYYPATGIYLGVAYAVTAADGLEESGIYVMGGPFGNSPTHVGTLRQYIEPATPRNYAYYKDKVVALWTYGYPFMVTTTSVTPVTNNTSYQTGAIKLSSCGDANSNPQADGSVLLECTAASDMRRHIVSLDPVTATLTDFTGTPPEGTTFVLAESNSTQPVSNSTSARIVDGWFYKDPNAGWRLLFQSDNGTTVIVKEGTFEKDGTVKVLRAYSR